MRLLPWPRKNQISGACRTSDQGASQPHPVSSVVLREARALTRYPGSQEPLCCDHCGPGTTGGPRPTPHPASEEGAAAGAEGVPVGRPWEGGPRVLDLVLLWKCRLRAVTTA